MDRPGAVNAAWPAPAKLNLFLHIVGRRPDGYHELQTAFQFLDYGDELLFEPRADGRVRRTADVTGVPEDADLTLRAARALQARSGCRLGCDIRVDKRIPLGGGLGGGSSDAATALVALNRLWALRLADDELAAIGLELGADVPVFVRGVAAWAEGIGEKLTPIQPPEPWYLVITPDCQTDTRQMYRHPALPRATPRIVRDNWLAGRIQTHNDFEPVVRASYRQVAEALDWLSAEFPVLPSPVSRLPSPGLSGSGASVFAAFEDRDAALAAQARVPAGWSAFVAQGRNRSPLHAALDRYNSRAFGD